MKILVCVDGSEQSRRVVKEALKIVQGCQPEQVLIIHVYPPPRSSLPLAEGEIYSQESLAYLREQFSELEKKEREKREEILTEAMEEFKNSGQEADTVIEVGHPSETITRIASEQEFDLIVIGSKGFGSRGVGGLKALLLGSVSNAVAQKASSNVLIVK